GDVFLRQRLVNREREPILMLIGARVLYGKPIARCGIAHDRPLPKGAFAGASKLEICRRVSNSILGGLDSCGFSKSGDAHACKRAYCSGKDGDEPCHARTPEK